MTARRTFFLAQAVVATALAALGGGCAGGGSGDPRLVLSPTLAIPTAAVLGRPRAEIPGFQLTVPYRMGAARAVKGSPRCQAVAVEARDAAFWTECGARRPVDRESNVVAGFDADNLQKFGTTVEALDAHVRGLNARIDAANAERDYWRERAAAQAASQDRALQGLAQ